MAKVSPILTNFTAGEISPRMMGRVDISKYNNGCETLENFMIMSQGGATKRPGTYFAAAAKFNNKKSKMVPFIFSTVQAYVLEFGDLYFRVFKDGGRIESPPGTPVEVVSPYTETDIFQMKWAQSADTMYLAHPTYPPRKLTRTSHTAWSINTINFLDGPYLTANGTTTTLTPSAASGNIAITASAATGINNDTGFQATDVGRLVRIKNGGTWGYAKITGVTSTTLVNATVVTAFAAATGTTNWALGAWSDTTGWPQSVSFHENRLVWGGNTQYPQTLWFSKTGDYENMAATALDGTVAADSAMVYTLLSEQVNSIRWISSGDVLSIGTGGGEFIMSGSNSKNDPITPTQVNAKRHSTRGSLNLRPVRIDTAVLYLQRAGRKLRELAYNLDNDAFTSTDVSVLSEHMTKGGINDIDYQQEPHSIVWMVRADGKLVCCTRNKEQEVGGWHRHSLGGTNTKVLSVAVIPQTDHDEVWFTVERTVNAATVKYVEYMKAEHEPTDPTDKNLAFYVDCGLSYTGVPIVNVGGLSHLVGETVSILADGAVKPSQVVSVGGTIALTAAASNIVVGLPYTATLKTVRFEGGGDAGTSQGKLGRINRVAVRFLNTLGGKLGSSAANMEDIMFRSGSDPMNSSPPLFTGDKRLTFSGSWDLDRQIIYTHDQPYPATVLAVMPDAQVNG